MNIVNIKHFKVKRITILFILISIYKFESYGQTNVSGGIFTNTVWTVLNSPYVVIGDVVVFPNVILTIEPGVTVKFNDGTRMEIRQSSLLAEGTSSDSIIFTSNSTLPFVGVWKSIFLNNSLYSHFYFCRIQYADTGIADYHSSLNMTKIKHTYFSSTHLGYWGNQGGTAQIDSSLFVDNSYGVHGHVNSYVNACSFFNNIAGIYGGGSVTNKNCIFKYNQTAILSGGNSEIVNCIIDSNETGIVLIASRDTIINCEIKSNSQAGVLIKASFGNFANVITNNSIEFNGIGIRTERPYDIIYCNKICNNEDFDFYNDESSSIYIPNNYWCTLDSGLIEAMVYNGYDDISLGLTYFIPIDALQCYLSAEISESITNQLWFDLFPNPSRSILELKFKSHIPDGNIKVYNTLGQLEYSTTTDLVMTGMDVSTLSVGAHIIHVSNDKSIGRKIFITYK